MRQSVSTETVTNSGIIISYVLFVLGLLLSITAVDLALSSIPIRALFILAALVVAIISARPSLPAVVWQSRKLLLIIVGSGCIGLLVSMMNGSPVGEIIRQLVEIQLQAVTGLVLATILTKAGTAKPLALGFIAIWGLTALVALAQAFGFDFAWEMRAAMGDIMNDPAITRRFYDRRERALGLSFTPVHLAAQTCLAFAAFAALRCYQTSGAALRQLDFPIIAAALIGLLVCIASGNRSPLAGLLLFLAIYLAMVAPRFILISLPVLVVLAGTSGIFLTMLDETGLRIASTSDGSATSRATLFRYGIRLLMNQPWGYGLLFDSKALSDSFVHHAIYLDNPRSIYHFSLHNFYLQILNKYGLLLLFLVPWIVPTTKAHLYGWLPFIPYLVHIAFHNDGPLSSDFLVWFLIPLFVPIITTFEKNKPPKLKSQKWARSYCRAQNILDRSAQEGSPV